jgi:hypothetical protein
MNKWLTQRRKGAKIFSIKIIFAFFFAAWRLCVRIKNSLCFVYVGSDFSDFKY